MTRTKSLYLALMAVLLSPMAANALPIAYINDGGGNVDYLNSLGHTVTYLNDPLSLTLADLADFDAVMVASNFPFSEATNIGNVLADFADSGGGVVLTEFVFQGVWALGGRIMTSGYSPFTIDPLSSNYVISSTLGTVFDPTNPILNGVATASTRYQANVGLDSGALLIADWTSGRHAIGINGSGNVIGLNLFPGITSDADTQRLIANSLLCSYDRSCSSVSVPEPGTLALLGLGLIGMAARRRKTV